MLQKTLHATHLLKLLDKMQKYEKDSTKTVGATEWTRDAGRTSWRETQMYCGENRWRFCLLRIIQESGVYQLGVPQGQGDSSAPNTTDPLICGFCLVTTPHTKGNAVEQSIVTWMFAWEFITNRHPVAPQLTNKHARTDRQADGRTEWNQYTPTTLFCGGIMTIMLDTWGILRGNELNHQSLD